MQETLPFIGREKGNRSSEDKMVTKSLSLASGGYQQEFHEQTRDKKQEEDRADDIPT